MDKRASDTPRGERICPQCGAESIITLPYHDTFNYGSGDSAVALHVDLPVRRCEACEVDFLDPEGTGSDMKRCAAILVSCLRVTYVISESDTG